MSARVDPSESCTVVWCSACPSWTEVAQDTAEGHNIAVDHEDRVHPQSRAASNNRFKWQQRMMKQHAA